MATIFISYNRRSEEVTKTLVGDLEKLGHTIWFDQDLTGGQAWWDLILERVRGCDVFVFVLDEKSLSSTACQREYGYAANLGKPILPILVTGDISANLLPPALSRTQFVDYRAQDRDAVLRLARAVTSMPPPKPLPDPLPAPPDVPISYLGQVGQQIESTAALTYESQSALVVDLRRSLRDPESAKDARTLLERLRKRRDLFATIAEEIDELLGIRRTGGSKRPSGPAPVPLDVTTRTGDGLQGVPAPPPPKPQPLPAEPDRPADTTPERAPPAGPVLRHPGHELLPGADPSKPERKPAPAGEHAPTGTERIGREPGTTPPGAGGQEPRSNPRVTQGARWKACVVGAGLGILAGVTAIQSGGDIPMAWVLSPGTAGALAGALVGTPRRGMITVSVGAVSGWVVGYLWAVAAGGSEAFAVGGLLAAPAGAVLGALVERLLRRRERSAQSG